MIRFAIAMLVSSVLIATGLFAQQGAPSSATGPGSQSQVPPGTKVCGKKTPAPCYIPPGVIKSPNPNYSIEARKKHIEGTVVLWLTVGADGLPHDIRVARSLGYGLDEEAINAVKRWTFKPSTMDGHPVGIQINVEVPFWLH